MLSLLFEFAHRSHAGQQFDLVQWFRDVVQGPRREGVLQNLVLSRADTMRMGTWEEQLTKSIEELHQSLRGLETLKGMVLVCSSCKKIRRGRMPGSLWKNSFRPAPGYGSAMICALIAASASTRTLPANAARGPSRRFAAVRLSDYALYSISPLLVSGLFTKGILR
mgnify:CR=1 FL=1